jgi:hypothetical protein
MKVLQIKGIQGTLVQVAIHVTVLSAPAPPPFATPVQNFRVLQNATAGTLVGTLQLAPGPQAQYNQTGWRLATDSSNGLFAVVNGTVVVGPNHSEAHC